MNDILINFLIITNKIFTFIANFSKASTSAIKNHQTSEPN